MIHEEYLHYLGSSIDDFVKVKPAESRNPVGGCAVTLKEAISCDEEKLNGYYYFLPGEYEDEELQVFFREKIVKGLKCKGDWVGKFIPLIADSIEFLSVDNKKLIVINKCFPYLRRISVNRVRLKSNFLPRVSHFSAVYEDASFHEISQCNLETLNLIGCKEWLHSWSEGNFSRLAFLGLRGGGCVDFSELDTLKSLRGIWIQDIKADVDVGQLKGVKALSELTLAYCRSVLGLEDLVGSGQVRAIQIFGCKNLNKKNILPFLEEKVGDVVFN